MRRLIQSIVGGMLIILLILWLKRLVTTGGEASFVSWLWNDVIRLLLYNPTVRERALSGLWRTGILMVAAVLLSAPAAILIGWQLSSRRHRIIWRWLEKIFGLTFGIPLLIMALWGRNFTSNPLASFATPETYVLAIAVLVIGEGLISHWSRSLSEVFLRLRERPYIEAHRARGLPLWPVLRRDASAAILDSLASRVVALLGGVVFVELVFKINGLGLMTLNAVKESTEATRYAELFVYSLIFIITVAVCRLRRAAPNSGL